MRTVDLGRTAAQAELLRIRSFIKRQTRRVIWGVVAAVFAIATVVMLHVVLFMVLAGPITPIGAALVVLAVDLVLLLIFGLFTLKSAPNLVETEARELRDRALLEMRESVAVAALVNPVGRVVVRSAGRGLRSALTPGFLSRKRRR